MMKKLIALALAALMLLALCACGNENKEEKADDDEMKEIVGGYSAPETPDMPEEVADLLEQAQAEMTGASYTAIALLGTQVVAGTNYRLLCKETRVTAEPFSLYVLVTLYADLEGNAEITEVLESTADAETDIEDIENGWTQPESPAVTAEAQTALETACKAADGAAYTPAALLATQVVAGTNYCLLCTSDKAESGYALVYVYEDLEGSAEITDVVDFAAAEA